MADIDLIRQVFRDLLTRNGDLAPFTDDERLFSTGRLHSLDGVEIVMFVEDKFGLDFSGLHFDPELIDGVTRVVELIKSRSG